MFDLPVAQLLDAAPDAMVVVDDAGCIVLVNRQTETQFGYARAELLGQRIEVLLPERFHEEHVSHRSNYSGSPRVRSMGEGLELYGRRKNGSEFPVEISLSPVATAQGSFVASAIRDASVHRDLEKSLTGILETSLNEIFIFDATSLRFIQVNEGGRRNLGYSMQELRNLTPVDIKPETNTEDFNEIIRPLREGAGHITFQTVHRRKDGTTYPVEVHLQQSALGAVQVFVAIILDITERQRAESAVRESHQLLEQRVIERTTELQAAIVEAERANTGKSRFLAAASHDLRQPLQAIGMYQSVLQRLFDSPRQREVGDKIFKSLDTMGELLDTLLDISKLDSGSIVPEKRDIHIRALLDRIVSDNIQQAEEKGLTLECRSEDCIVNSDPALLARVVDNFVTNAIRYTKHGTVCVDCRCEDGKARIEVTDTGIGIPQDALAKVFDEYYQLDNDVRDRRKGLGLGLSIVKHIAALLEHPLDVASVEGEGSTFAVELPLGASAPSPMPERDTAPRRPGPCPIVLLVDDDPAVVDATTMMLEGEGIHVFSALDGNAALAHLTQGVRPDILVTDFRLPGYDGVEVIRRVRAAAATDLPAVLMTGDTSAREIEHARLTNYTLLHKPVDTNRLIDLIATLTGPRSSTLSAK